MKKKKMKIAALSLAVLVAGTGAFHAYGNYQQSGESDALLNENILALSSESEGGEEEFSCKLLKDDCVIRFYNVYQLRGFLHKYGVSGRYRVGEEYDFSDLTKYYAAYSSWDGVFNVPRVRCGKDFLCADLRRDIGNL